MATALSDWLPANRNAVEALLKSNYGIVGTIHLLAGEYDLNFRVESGERCYLPIFRYPSIGVRPGGDSPSRSQICCWTGRNFGKWMTSCPSAYRTITKA